MIAVAFVISLPLREARKEEQQQQVVVDDFKERYAKAKALFDERCKTAGEKIYRTVAGVDSVSLVNVRPASVSVADQFERYDPYGYEGGGEEYVKSFLAGHWKTCAGNSSTCAASNRAFEYVDAKNDRGLQRIHTVDKSTKKLITVEKIAIPELVYEPLTGTASRYAIEWRDVSTDDDRSNWIAGGQLVISDTKTNEIIAERVGYLLDTGLGDIAGARSPWAWARQYTKGCPIVEEHGFLFVRKVLKAN